MHLPRLITLLAAFSVSLAWLEAPSAIWTTTSAIFSAVEFIWDIPVSRLFEWLLTSSEREWVESIKSRKLVIIVLIELPKTPISSFLCSISLGISWVTSKSFIVFDEFISFFILFVNLLIRYIIIIRHKLKIIIKVFFKYESLEFIKEFAVLVSIPTKEAPIISPDLFLIHLYLLL